MTLSETPALAAVLVLSAFVECTEYMSVSVPALANTDLIQRENVCLPTGK